MYDFSKKYNRKNFLEFLKNLLPDDLILKEEEYKDETKKDLIKKIYKLGAVKSLDYLAILEAEHNSANDPRISLTKKIFSVFNKLSINKALVIFYCQDSNNYRFSLIESNYEWKSDTIIKRNFSLPRRLSFFLGPDSKLHTPNNQLKNKIVDYKDLKNRFNIEIVNEEFFEHYKNLYLNLHKSLEKDRKFNEFIKQKKIKKYIFAKKLLGQIIFCYFLQKKGCLGANKNQNLGAGNKNFLRDQFCKYEIKKKNFYNDFLEYFFYKGLNTENANNYVESIQCKTPYLNGGLFEEIEGYNWQKESLKISNEIFSNETKSGILDIFDLYNFTVDENDDFEVEIGIDPEMLGKVFENLLPENFRKGKGSFYTPRKIVKFMCVEVLKNYLLSKPELKSKSDFIINLVENNPLFFEKYFLKNPNSNNKVFLENINKYLINIKICDPAIGSGAFPVQLMNEIVGIRKNILEMLNIKYSTYNLKRDFIENSIYGVDIDKGAIEISKLRLWLSLIVDEKNINNINPLPNLSFKIIQGNSLIQKYNNFDFDKDETDELFVDEETNKYKAELIEIQKKYFNLSSRKKKIEVKELLNKKIDSLIKKKATNTTKNKFLIKDERNFFLWKIFFLDVFQKGGFDVIIGNPPYVFVKSSDLKGISKEDKNYYNKKYTLIDYKINYYILFIELASRLLKKSGFLSFIIPNNWMTIATNISLRKFILNKENVLIINCLKQIFLAGVDASILSFKNTDAQNSNLLLMEYDENFKHIKKTNTSFFKNDEFIINFDHLKHEKGYEIFKKIEQNSMKLFQVAKVKTGLQAYGVGGGMPKQTLEMKNQRVYHDKKRINESYIEYLESDDIHRYTIKWSGQFLKYGDNLFRKRDFKIYTGDRILVKQIPSSPPYSISAIYVKKTYLNDVNSHIINNMILYDPHFFLGILNSKLTSFWFTFKFGKMQRNTFPQFKIGEMLKFPLPKILNKTDTIIKKTQKMIDLVKKKINKPEKSELDKEIDELVYSFFGINNDEIREIENYFDSLK